MRQSNRVFNFKNIRQLVIKNIVKQKFELQETEQYIEVSTTTAVRLPNKDILGSLDAITKNLNTLQYLNEKVNEKWLETN